MTEQSVLHKMEHWGYYLLPKAHPESPGHTGLLVAIRATSTGQHFDPESMRLRLCDKADLAGWVTLKLQSSFSGSQRVCPGRVVLRDRADKRVHFFTFGGSLETTSISGETVYSLWSPGPILEISSSLESVPDQLAFEVEALLGKLKAKWGSDDTGFTERLAKIDPLQFYLASLQAILKCYQRNRAFRDSSPELFAMLLKEKEWLVQVGQWPATPPSLEDLLAPQMERGGE